MVCPLEVKTAQICCFVVKKFLIYSIPGGLGSPRQAWRGMWRLENFLGGALKWNFVHHHHAERNCLFWVLKAWKSPFLVLLDAQDRARIA